MLWRRRVRAAEAAAGSDGRRNYYGGPPRPVARYDSGQDMRRQALVWLGVVILIGFFMPVIGPSMDGGVTIEFPNFAVLGGGAPGHVILLALYPGIAGLIVILVASLSSGPGRSAVLMGLGALFLILLLTFQPEGRRGGMSLADALSQIPPSITAFLMILLFAFVGLFVGSRVRFYRPASQVAAIIGAVGGILCFMSLLLPVLPSEAGGIFLVAPFKILGEGGGVVMGLGLLGTIACLVGSSILCIMNVRPHRDAESLGQRASQFLVIALVTFGVCILIEMIRGLTQAGAPGIAVLAVFLALVKGACCLVGLLLLLPVGLSDLVVNLTPLAPSVTGGGPAAPSAPLDDVHVRLARFKKLLDDGSITQAEYDRKKSELMQRL